MSALRFVGALPEHFPLCPLTPRPICTPMSGSNARPWLVYSGSSLMPSSDDDVSNLLDRSTMTLTGVVLQSFQRRWDYERQSCGQWLDALSEKWYILDAWGPRGSRADRASSRTLVAPVRAVLARPCGPSDALLGPLGRAIVPNAFMKAARSASLSCPMKMSSTQMRRMRVPSALLNLNM